MKVEEMKRIAEARTPGKRYATDAEDFDYPDWSSQAEWRYTVSLNPERSGWETDSGHGSYCISKADAEFYAMAANNFEKLMAVVEAAKEATTGGLWLDERTTVPLLDKTTRKKLAEAIEALENE